EVGQEHALNDARRVLGFDVTIDVAREPRLRAVSAADQHVVALDSVTLLGDLHLAGQEADVADVMLRAGMMTSGQVDVDRAIERQMRLAMPRNILGMALGVGGRKPAADITRT